MSTLSVSEGTAPIGQPGWTGGQYSLIRVLFGAYLTAHFGMLALGGGVLGDPAPALTQDPLLRIFPNIFALWDAPGFVNAILIGAVCASLAITFGWQRRVAALYLGYVAACLFLRDPMSSARSLPYLILLHAAVPLAPFGAWTARGRSDPGNGWRMPLQLFQVAWILMSIGYTHAGVTKLTGVQADAWIDGSALAQLLASPIARELPSELLLRLPELVLRIATWSTVGMQLAFVLLALSARTRRIAWTWLLLTHVCALLLTRSADLPLALIALHLFTFDPRWFRARVASEPEFVLYDGDCGLCHHTVRFVIAEDSHGRAFRFATQSGETFQRLIPADQRADLPDAIVVVRSDGVLLLRSDSIVHILHGLGGLWSALGSLLSWIPRPLRDTGYDLVARVRKRIFAAPDAACPLMPADLQTRFSD
ncbi:MAG: putative DCC family thiol-disulfide oxidoreductase YuxK [Planctomycetota bacterium]